MTSTPSIRDLKPAGMAVAEAFATTLAGHRRTLAEAGLDPDGVAELLAMGFLVRDHRGDGLARTISVTDAGARAIASHWLLDLSGNW